MNISILCIDEGHTKSGADYGATGNGIIESLETRVFGNLLTQKLQKLGVVVDKCTIDIATSVSDSINKRVAISKQRPHDLIIIIHFNSVEDPAANGCELFILPNKGNYYSSTNSFNKNKQFGEDILEAVCKAGNFVKRGNGVKYRDDLGMLLHTADYAVYLEICFLSNKSDVDKYIANKDKIASSIVKVLTGKDSTQVKVGWIKDATGWWYQYSDASYPREQWILLDNYWYYFDKNGYAIHSGWKYIDGKYYYMNTSCKMETNKWIATNNKYYYVDCKGIMQTGWINVDNKTYYLDSSGAMLKNTTKDGHKIGANGAVIF